MLTIIGNLKGGTGKSTVTFNLAIWLAYERAGVHVFDLDPQATLLDTNEVRTEECYTPEFEVSDNVEELLDLQRSGLTREVLVDVSASNLDDMKKALAIADRVVVPVQPSQADVWSTQKYLRIVSDAANGNSLEVLGFINRADTHIGIRESDQAEEALASLQGINPIHQRLYQRTAYRRSFSEGLAVFELDPMGKAAKEVRSLAEFLYNS